MSKVLVIDDTSEHIDIIDQILLNDEVFVATNGKTGLELAEKILPNIILLDINMPNMNGYELCRRLKSSKKLHNIPVIFITSNEGYEFEEIAFDLGAADYITKPFNSTILKARVKTHIGFHELQSNLDNEIKNREKEISKLKELLYKNC